MMRIIQLPTFWTVLIDFIVWFFIHIGVSRLMVTIPLDRFSPENWIYRIRRWELKGIFYSRHVAIRKWKHLLPDGSPFLGEKGFSKKHLGEKNREYLDLFLHETCRAELTHWIIMLFGPFFFLWNPLWVGFLMIAYAIIENLPLIMAQRYNRIRLLRVLDREKLNR
jgi:glycosyl-4,4'-diaponeurosporenoate acyltransferase